MEVFSCTIPRFDRTYVVECKVKNQQVGRVLGYMFECYLDASEFGINLAPKRDEIITSAFQYHATARPCTIKDLSYYVQLKLKVQCETTTTTDPEAETFTYIPVCTLYPSTREEQDFICSVFASSTRYTIERGHSDQNKCDTP